MKQFDLGVEWVAWATRPKRLAAFMKEQSMAKRVAMLKQARTQILAVEAHPEGSTFGGVDTRCAPGVRRLAHTHTQCGAPMSMVRRPAVEGQ